MSTSWKPFVRNQGPAKSCLAWFRVPGTPHKNYTLEFVNNFALCGMGLDPPEIWPGFAGWDGYTRTAPTGLEWRPIEPGDKDEDVRVSGLELLPCPFCGGSARLKVKHSEGPYRLLYFPHLANRFLCECPCGQSSARGESPLQLAEKWNTRYQP